MSDFVEVHREPFPGCNLPDNLDIPVWRYIDMDKFDSILENQALYLCRADKLERFEGTYSRQQILEMEDWFTLLQVPELTGIERERRRQDRLKTYISCWCMGECDLDLMWKGYIRTAPGVAIKSSVRKLVNVCDNAIEYWPLDISTVTYFDHAGGEYMSSFVGTPVAFLHKDLHFKLDNEIRIIHWPNISEPTPSHVFLPVNIAELIVGVFVQPGAENHQIEFVRRRLDDFGLNDIPVLASRDDRDLIE